MLLVSSELLALCEWRLDVVTTAAAVTDLAIEVSSMSSLTRREYVHSSRRCHERERKMENVCDDDAGRTENRKSKGRESGKRVALLLS